MKTVLFNSESNLVCTSTLETYDILELKEIAESVNITTLNANKKTLIQKIKIHFNQSHLLSERIKASLSDSQFTISDSEYSEFLAFKAKQKTNPTFNANQTTVPYSQLPVGTIVSKNNTILLIGKQFPDNATLLISAKLAWKNTNQNVSGLGSNILVNGNNSLPENFDNEEYNDLLKRCNNYLREASLKQVKSDIKDILNLADILTEREREFINRFSDVVSMRNTTSILTELSQSEPLTVNELETVETPEIEL